MTVLKRLRQLAGWTQADVSEQIGCTREYIDRIENRGYRLPGKTASRLAAIFVTVPAELVDEDRLAKLI